MVNTNNLDGYILDPTNIGSRDGEKTDKMSKRTQKVNAIKMCVKSEAGCITEQTK